jgi:hypothetical protein
MKRLLIVLALLSLPGFAQTAIQTRAQVEDGPLLVAVQRDNVNAGCGPTCTLITYSFCLDETPGCEEGWMWINGKLFTGQVGSSYSNAAKLILSAEVFTGNAYGTSWYCWAWRASDGACTEETDFPIGQVIDLGNIDVTFQKIEGTAYIANVTQYTASGATLLINHDIEYQFPETGAGTLFGTPISGSACCMVYVDTVETTAPLPSSQLLAGRASLKALRRLKAIEAKMAGH